MQLITQSSIHSIINSRKLTLPSQSTNQPINQSTNQPINQSTNQKILFDADCLPTFGRFACPLDIAVKLSTFQYPRRACLAGRQGLIAIGFK